MKKTAEFFNCDEATVKKACKEFNLDTSIAKKIHCKTARKNISRALNNNKTAYNFYWSFI